MKPKLSDRELFLSWFNDFLTVKAFASYYGLTESDALDLINRERARQI